MRISVGAGLPAMQTPRCISYTEVMLSQASQLPPLILAGLDIALSQPATRSRPLNATEKQKKISNANPAGNSQMLRQSWLPPAAA